MGSRIALKSLHFRLPILQGTRTPTGVAGNCNPMQCEPSTSFHWEDCACNQACRTRSCTRACTMARPHCTKCRPKSLQNVYKAIGSTEGAKRAVDDVAKAEARASEAEAKSRGGPKAQGPRSPPPKVAPTSAPKLLQAHHHLLQPAPQRPNLHQRQMPTSAKSSRPSPTDKPQPAPQYKKKRTD